ncbi:hypothetical protein LSTR_LSTR009549 [Laodelphax striatellus]|uniref:Uncharacterized protein n=1 Tax=Laodelphax striatellus TaxID=195883 RepID=A0A482WQA3_LAOST|nr:hypothetical protein LSTR_LSTR017222 [Laodelphax striatellus]RZF36453.1 hypothetical protein LSTR_LSTR009549 [Laodelphax striatellus]
METSVECRWGIVKPHPAAQRPCCLDAIKMNDNGQYRLMAYVPGVQCSLVLAKDFVIYSCCFFSIHIHRGLVCVVALIVNAVNNRTNLEIVYTVERAINHKPPLAVGTFQLLLSGRHVSLKKIFKDDYFIINLKKGDYHCCC